MSSDRDFVLARLAASRALTQNALDGIDEAIALFIEPDEDEKGESRISAIDSADDYLGRAGVVVQKALEVATEVIADWNEPELDEEDDEGDDEDEEADDPPEAPPEDVA